MQGCLRRQLDRAATGKTEGSFIENVRSKRRKRIFERVRFRAPVLGR